VKTDEKYKEDDLTLHKAAFSGNLIKITNALKKGANINLADSSKLLPLHYAAQEKHFEAVKLLLDNGSIIDSLSDQSYPTSTPLHLALTIRTVHEQSISAKIATLLMNKKANLAAVDSENKNAIHYIVIYNHLELLQLIIKNITNINKLSNLFNTKDMFQLIPLDYAITAKNQDIIKLLLPYSNNKLPTTVISGIQATEAKANYFLSH
jgi:ankyrin repeat protein